MLTIRNLFIITSVIIAVLCPGCSRSFELSDISLGSGLSSKGLITEPGLDFKFNYEKTGKYSDLFNYIYFKGDTVCFSFDFTKDVSGKVNAYFVDTRTNKRIAVERTQILHSRVYGFSLAGSLLEYMNNEKLSEKINPSERRLSHQFRIVVEIERDGKTKAYEKQSEFAVSF